MSRLAAALAACLLSSAALAAECPVKFDQNYADSVQNRITRQKNCKAGAALAELCGVGSSMDIGIAGTAYQKCEKEVGARLTKAQKTELTKALAACNKKYAGKQGTMYMSFTAYCKLNAIKKYAK